MTQKLIIGMKPREWLDLSIVVMSALALNFLTLTSALTTTKLERDGVTALATITGRHKPDWVLSKRTYRIFYNFDLPNGSDKIESWTDVDRQFYDAIVLKQTLMIRYLPDKPSMSDIVGNKANSLASAFIALALFDLAFLIAFWLWFLGKQYDDFWYPNR